MFSALYWSCSTGWEPELCRLLEQNARLLAAADLRRARDYYLYTASSKKSGIPERLCDLYLNGGQALLGHRPAGVGSRLKNVMSRGLYGSFPCSERRLELQDLFPEFPSFRIYQSAHILPSFAALAKDRAEGCSRGCALIAGQKIALWRPLAASNPQRSLASLPYLVPVLQFSSLPLLILCPQENSLPPSDIYSPLQLEALVQAVAQTRKLLACRDSYLHLSGLRRIFTERQYWLEDGIYLYWNGPLATYAELWQHFLREGFLLPPNPLAPLILSPFLLAEGKTAGCLSSQGKRLRDLWENCSKIHGI